MSELLTEQTFFELPNLYEAVSKEWPWEKCETIAAQCGERVERFVLLAGAVRRGGDDEKIESDETTEQCEQLLALCRDNLPLPNESFFTMSLQWALGNMLCGSKSVKFADVFTKGQTLASGVGVDASTSLDTLYVLAAMAIVTRDCVRLWAFYESYLTGEVTENERDNIVENDFFAFLMLPAHSFHFLRELAQSKAWCHNVAGCLTYVALFGQSYNTLFAMISSEKLICALSSMALAELGIQTARSLHQVANDKSRNTLRPIEFTDEMRARMDRVRQSRAADDVGALLIAFARLQSGEHYEEALKLNRERFKVAAPADDDDDVDDDEKVVEQITVVDVLCAKIDMCEKKQAELAPRRAALVTWLGERRDELLRESSELEKGNLKTLIDALYAKCSGIDKKRTDEFNSAFLGELTCDENFDRFIAEFWGDNGEELVDALLVNVTNLLRKTDAKFPTTALLILALRHYQTTCLAESLQLPPLVAQLKSELYDAKAELLRRRMAARLEAKMKAVVI